MLALALKAGFGVAAILTAMGVAQSQTFADMLVALVAAGMLPGTNLQIPAELVLVAVAGALMLITAYLYKDYLHDRERLRRAARDFENYAEDPSYETLIPGLSKVSAIRQAAGSAATDAVLSLYFWARSLGRPITAQAIAARKDAGLSFVRFDGWATGRTELKAWADSMTHAFRAGVSFVARKILPHIRPEGRRALLARASKVSRTIARGAAYWIKMFDLLADKTGHWFMRLISFSSSKKNSGQNEDLL